MATARESHMRRMARLMKIGRMRADGKTPAQIASYYGISVSYVYMLLGSFERVTSARYINNKQVNPYSAYMRKEEMKELSHIKDWLEFLAKEPK